MNFFDYIENKTGNIKLLDGSAYKGYPTFYGGCLAIIPHETTRDLHRILGEDDFNFIEICTVPTSELYRIGALFFIMSSYVSHKGQNTSYPRGKEELFKKNHSIPGYKVKITDRGLISPLITITPKTKNELGPNFEGALKSFSDSFDMFWLKDRVELINKYLNHLISK